MSLTIKPKQQENPLLKDIKKDIQDIKRIAEEEGNLDLAIRAELLDARTKALTSSDSLSVSSKSDPKISEKGLGLSIQHYHNRRGHGTLYGLRGEREIDLITRNSLNISAIGASEMRMNSHSFTISPGVGFKLQVGKGEEINGYATAMGTANLGVMGGRLTAGVGLRGAVGVEANIFYAELFGEQATNYCSQGVATGVRLRF